MPVLEILEERRSQSSILPESLGLSDALLPQQPPPLLANIIERQVRFGFTEDDRAVEPRIEAYWRAVLPSYIKRRDAIIADQQAAGDKEFARFVRPGWWNAWSAAFSSWAYVTAGTDFPRRDGHFKYLRILLQSPRPGFSVTDISDYTPVAGDLVCFLRDGPPEETYQQFLDSLRNETIESRDMHCDVVVRVESDRIMLIGGNVKNTVIATVVRRTASGHVERSAARPWIAVVRLSEAADPCATPEAVHLRLWNQTNAAREARATLLSSLHCSSA